MKDTYARTLMVAILRQITTQRTQDIEQKGFSFGHHIPPQRLYPLVKPRLDLPLLIAEVKRSSPSSGELSSIQDPILLAGKYLNGGAGAISVLCEEKHFQGTLQDLMAIKAAYPNACILRKDFIQYVQEIEISYRAGADMVLLIAAMFQDVDGGFEKLQALYNECLTFGITPLVEVHNQQEIEFISPLHTALVGINARNLHTFEIDIAAACALRKFLGNQKVIFESGIHSPHLAFMVGSAGFDGILCGSYLVAHTNPTRALEEIKSALYNAKKRPLRFYTHIFQKFAEKQLMLKICGITNLDDALMVLETDSEVAMQYGQEQYIAMLGFIFVQHSTRFIETKQAKNIIKALKVLYPHILYVGIVNDDKKAFNRAKILYDEGFLDALQLHGLHKHNPRIFATRSLDHAQFCHYVAQNIATQEDFCTQYDGFCLLDSQSTQGGGSGKSIDMEVLQTLKIPYLCLAGGVQAQNISNFLSLQPSLLDINSGIESKIGKKDKLKLKELLEILHRKNLHWDKS